MSTAAKVRRKESLKNEGPPAWAVLQCTARDAMEGLLRLARAGDDDAACALWHLSGRGNASIDVLLAEAGPLLRATIEESPCLPANLPANRKQRDKLIATLRPIGLASKCEINIKGKFDANAPMSKVVLFCYMFCLRALRNNPRHAGPDAFDGKAGPFPGWKEWAEANGPKIPRNLTRKNARIWADLAGPLLSIFSGERFEAHRLFAFYRTSKASEGATAGKVRGELRRIWQQSWSSMANP